MHLLHNDATRCRKKSYVQNLWKHCPELFIVHIAHCAAMHFSIKSRPFVQLIHVMIIRQTSSLYKERKDRASSVAGHSKQTFLSSLNQEYKAVRIYFVAFSSNQDPSGPSRHSTLVHVGPADGSGPLTSSAPTMMMFTYNLYNTLQIQVSILLDTIL